MLRCDPGIFAPSLATKNPTFIRYAHAPNLRIGAVVFANQLGCPFSQHHDRHIRVAGNDRGKHRSIRDA